MKYFFTPQNGINIVLINQTGWDGFQDGSFIICVYVNDTAGNIANLHITLTKELPENTKPSQPAIPFGDFFLVFTGVSMVSLVIIISKKLKDY